MIDLTNTPIGTLNTWLGEAQTAYHKLQTGGKQASVSFGGSKAVTYTQANAQQLAAWINTLQAEIDRRNGKTTRRAPVRFEF